ncbi:PRC-barrel domain-containing protein [Methanocaldococcus fervens]|uniref:PRC-barrel domain protein n=1 Tax=Methanocaldococcus fervens (strain DSM 4213 / JCM 15782 / AG86) TaxID=573064 RepID=C7P5S4_METFA|nr:PRC-barrel domain-containing protein [Methanocaldococcus fervens]ACV23906.1 PRC-barrel domain protein [Methanocaldococcus fervens AG86]
MAIRVSDILEKPIYTTTAVYVGKVYDVMLDLNKGAISGLIVSDIQNGCLKEYITTPGKKVVLPFNLITAIGNIILVKPPAESGYGFLKK